MRLSPFTPIFFNADSFDGLTYCRNVQTFSHTDRILVEFIGKQSESMPQVVIVSAKDREPIYVVDFNVWKMNDIDVIYFTEIVGLSNGAYQMKVGENYSETFFVTDDEDMLRETTLIQYRMKDNRSRKDVVSVIDGMPYFFDFRVPGGFKRNAWKFSVENEQFEDSNTDIIELFSRESTQQTFTLGHAVGVPVWFAELLNRLLTCSYVYFDGVRYSRKDSSVPEAQQVLDNSCGLVFTQMLQKVQNLNPTIEESNHLIMRRLDTEYRAVDDDNLRTIKI